MRIQIIVPAINLWGQFSQHCLDTIEVAMMRATARGHQCRVLFIDNASTDMTQGEAGKRVSEVFVYKRNDERWGFQKSVNYGVNDAWAWGAEMALVCNNDIVIHPEAIWRLADRFSKDDGTVGMVTCLDVRGDMQKLGLTPDDLPNMVAKEYEVVDESPHPNFSAFAINRACWEEVGEFDELFFPAYFEDNDYHYRMQLLDVGAIVYPPALFYHFGSGTQNNANENGTPIVSSPLFENARANYFKKWRGVPGQEKFRTPYNNPELCVKSTKQNRDAQ